jgi:hypothetical protein
MAIRVDLTGQKFGYLTVLRYVGKSSTGQSLFECQCECGKIITCHGCNLQKSNGREGSRSCGSPECLKKYKKYFTTHNLTNTKEYWLWHDIMRRCYDKKAVHYKNYGGRGIVIYEDWKDVKNFYNYLQTLDETYEQFGSRTGEKPTLDRINVNGNYEPGNLRWTTYQEQAQNKTSNILNEQLVKLILWDNIFNGLTATQIKRKYNLLASRPVIQKVIQGLVWSNININKELEEYRQFGTVNGIAVPK